MTETAAAVPLCISFIVFCEAIYKAECIYLVQWMFDLERNHSLLIRVLLTKLVVGSLHEQHIQSLIASLDLLILIPLCLEHS